MNALTRALGGSVLLLACSSGTDGNSLGQSTQPVPTGYGAAGAAGFWTSGAAGIVNAGGFTNPGAGGFANPGAGGFTMPSMGGSIDPGAGGFVNPAAGGSVNPGAGGFVDPGAGGVSNPGAGGFVDSGAGGAAPGSGGVASGTGGSTGTGGAPATPSNGCGQTLPPVSDYGAMGPFQVTTTNNSGPDGTYTIIRPATLGQNGFLHPPTTWGNGITTTPSLYPGLLNTIASHGFVIVASNSTSVTAQLMTAGLDWLVAQDTASGVFQGKLDTKCLVSIGYSLGGGAAVTTGGHADVVTTVSMHGLSGPSDQLHGPLLLFTSTQDTFVSAAQFVTPTYDRSTVQTFYATLTGTGDNGHLTPIGDAGVERAPMVAWLRLWAYGDQGARSYFYGDDCILCKTPWGNPQRKNWPTN